MLARHMNATHQNTSQPSATDHPVIRAISREDMAALPIRRYESKAILVANEQDLQRSTDDILQESVVGFDTETRPAFTKGESYPPSLAQVATAHAVYLFQLRRAECHPLLARMLQAESIVKTGVALAYDLRTLKAVLPFNERNVLDLGIVARRNGLEQSGVRNLAGILLGFRIPKGAKTSNWAATTLNSAQITYAATDAWACRELYLRFESLGMLSVMQTDKTAGEI